jgi:uncharacterized protein YndB with AHSA1/START domain
MEARKVLTVQATVAVPIDLAWNAFTQPTHVVNWNNASDDWHCPSAKNDLSVGGRFVYVMAARDGSMSFDFGGTYDAVKLHELISYTMDDGRKVTVTFAKEGNGTHVTESFEAESMNSLELQQGGWQAILDNYKKYAESL